MSWYHCIKVPSVTLPLLPHVMVSLYPCAECHIATVSQRHGFTVSERLVSFCHCFPMSWYHCIWVPSIILPLFAHVMVSLYLSSQCFIFTVSLCHGCIQVARAGRKAAGCSGYSLFQDGVGRCCVGTLVVLILSHDDAGHCYQYYMNIILTRRFYQGWGLAGASGVAVSV